jgi:hypothetical protein
MTVPAPDFSPAFCYDGENLAAPGVQTILFVDISPDVPGLQKLSPSRFPRVFIRLTTKPGGKPGSVLIVTVQLKAATPQSRHRSLNAYSCSRSGSDKLEKI